MELKNMKQEETKRVEIYYERIQKLAHGLQVPTTNLTIVFRVGLQSYLKITTIKMKHLTLQHHKEAAMLCEKCMTITKVKNTLLVPQSTK